MGFESTTPVKARVFILLYLVIIKHLAKIFEKLAIVPKFKVKTKNSFLHDYFISLLIAEI